MGVTIFLNVLEEQIMENLCVRFNYTLLPDGTNVEWGRGKKLQATVCEDPWN